MADHVALTAVSRDLMTRAARSTVLSGRPGATLYNGTRSDAAFIASGRATRPAQIMATGETHLLTLAGRS
jgi:hypothetical protein